MDTWLNEKDKEHYRTNGNFMKKKIVAHMNESFYLKVKKIEYKKTIVDECPHCKNKRPLIRDGRDNWTCTPCFLSSL